MQYFMLFLVLFSFAVLLCLKIFFGEENIFTACKVIFRKSQSSTDCRNSFSLFKLFMNVCIATHPDKVCHCQIYLSAVSTCTFKRPFRARSSLNKYLYHIFEL